METPIPTPFDIIEPGPGALVPTGMAWILLLSVSILIASVSLLRSRKPGPAKIYRALEKLLSEIKQATDSLSRQGDLERIIRLAKRIISPYLETEAASLTSTELRHLSESYKAKHQEATDAIAAGLTALADLEDLAYAPNSSNDQPDKRRDLVATLISRLESLVRGVKPI